MCHHYKSVRNPPADLADEFSVRANLYDVQLPLAGFYPLQTVPIIRMNDVGQREMVGAQWGLLPGWWKPSGKSKSPSAFQRKTFNARSESVHEKPTFRAAFKTRRCLLPAVEFFEKGHYFHLPEHRPFAFAGLWERCQQEGEAIETCTLLTTEPNEAVKSVGHHRMPVLLTDPEQYGLWLNPDVAERPPLEKLFQPYPAGEIQFYPAEKA